MDRLLDEIAADQARAGEVSQPPATDEQIAELARAVRTAFGAILPEAFIRFLRRANGLDYNGLVLYGAGQTIADPGAGGFWQGLVEVNALWRENEVRSAYLALGETDMDLLTVALDGTAPVLRDKVGDDVVEEFATLDAAIAQCLQRRL